jgi:cell division protease FtsH
MSSKRRLARASHAAPGPPSRRGSDRRDSPEEIRRIAMHEAGHAVAASVLGLQLDGVSLKRRSLSDGTRSLGFTASKVCYGDIAGKGAEAALPWLIQSNAGLLSEAFVNDDASEVVLGGKDDRDTARKIAVIALCEITSREGDQCEISDEELDRNRDRIESLLGHGREVAKLFVDKHRLAIFAVAEAIVGRRTLTGAEVAAIVEASKATEA